MQDRVEARFGRVKDVALVSAVAVGLVNTLVHPAAAVSEWLSAISIALSITALFLYGVSYGMQLRR